MLINSYRFSAPADGLLDQYTGASAAFSLRELAGAWAGQAVVEVRRNGGSPATTTFTAAEVADGTLTTWTGSNSGYVRTWYDQSGNGFDATQTTDSAQPVLVASGTLNTTNGEPTIDFDGSNHYLSNAGSIPYSGGVSWYSVHDFDSVGSSRLWVDTISSPQGYVLFKSDGFYYFNDDSGGFKSFSSGSHSTSQELSSLNFDDTTGDYAYARNGSNTTGSIPSFKGPINTTASSNFGIMAGGDGGSKSNGQMQELIIYPNDQSANRTGIETNMNDHYGVYV